MGRIRIDAERDAHGVIELGARLTRPPEPPKWL
jgi:hypothetical protein